MRFPIKISFKITIKMATKKKTEKKEEKSRSDFNKERLIGQQIGESKKLIQSIIPKLKNMLPEGLVAEFKEGDDDGSVMSLTVKKA